MQPFELLLVALSTFYCAHAISATHGPAHIFERLRARVPMAECLVCLSPWFALSFAVMLLTPLAILVWILSAAGASVLLWRYTGGSNL